MPTSHAPKMFMLYRRSTPLIGFSSKFRMAPRVSIIFAGFSLSNTMYSGNFFPPFVFDIPIIPLCIKSYYSTVLTVVHLPKKWLAPYTVTDNLYF